WVDRSRRPYVSQGTAYIPVKEGYFWDTELSPKILYRGRGFFMAGTIAILQGRKPTDTEIDRIEAWKKPAAILWVRSCRGVERIPDVLVLRGEPCEVTHREMGMTFRFDPLRVMFSQGNRTEKARMMRTIRSGERVADMFAGIGYFTIPAARAGARVHAMELNPVAYGFLCRNIRDNHVASRVLPECGDCRDLLDGWYDRIIMGHFDAAAFLDTAAGHTLPGGTIHLHATGSHPPDIPESCQGWFGGTAIRRVKKVAPHTWHYVLDLKVV
ncbi:MAG: SAM-dependent methyltransferase, partial [Methanomicrobiales archaeon]|nr:SAM-dependent methyltransferase [Methanomicrobiales archaeon]